MYFTKIWVHRLPGIQQPFFLGPLSSQINIILGANASGKTSICKAFRLGLWHNAKHNFLPLHVDFDCVEGVTGESKSSFTISVQDQKRHIVGEAGKRFIKALPEERWASCFSLVVDEIFDGENQSFEQRIFQEFLGGYDLEQSLDSLIQKNVRLSVLLKEWQQVARSAQQNRTQSELCLKECSQLPDLEKRLEQLQKSQTAHTYFLKVRDLYEIQAQIAFLKKKLKGFPLVVQEGNVQPGDEKELERLLEERSSREQSCHRLKEKIQSQLEGCRGCPDWSNQDIAQCLNLLDQLVALNAKEREYSRQSLQEQRRLQAHSRFLDLQSPLEHFSAKKAQELYQLWAEASELQQRLRVVEEQIHDLGSTFSLYTLPEISEGIAFLAEQRLFKRIGGIQTLLVLGGGTHLLGALCFWWLGCLFYAISASAVAAIFFLFWWRGVNRYAYLDVQMSKKGFSFVGNIKANYLKWVENLLQEWGQAYVAQEMESRKQELKQRLVELNQLHKQKETHLQEQLDSYGFVGYGFQLSFTRAWEDLYRAYENFQEMQEHLFVVREEKARIFALWKDKVLQFQEQPDFVEAHEGHAICRRIQEKHQLQIAVKKDQQELAMETQWLKRIERDLLELQARVGKGCSCEDVAILVQLCREYEHVQGEISLLQAQFEKQKACLSTDTSVILEFSKEELDKKIQESMVPGGAQQELATKIGVLKERIQERERSCEGIRLLKREEQAYEALEKAWHQKVGNILVQLLKEEADALFVKQCQPLVVQKAGAWFQVFTQRKFYLEATKHENSITYGARNISSGVFHPLDQLSRGTRIQLILAIRFAFVAEEEGSRGVQLPLCLDEVLAHNDPEAQGAVLDVLEELIYTGRQIFYFTCHPQVVDAWRQKFGEQVFLHHLTLLKQNQGGRELSDYQREQLWGECSQELGQFLKAGAADWGGYVHTLGLPELKEGQPLELVPAYGLTITPQELVLLHELNILYVGELQRALSKDVIAGEFAVLFQERLELFSQIYTLYQQGRVPAFSKKELIDAGISEELELFWEVAVEAGCQAHLFLSRLRMKPLGRGRKVVTKTVIERLSKVFMERKCWDPRPQLSKEVICDVLSQRGLSGKENEFLQHVVQNFLP